ncbi:alpha-methylacyl-CoA racemase-like [Actinia tenebrosa]|uniref:Alpha-methylacyl-CoA racemase-like n=1 Tax=Actinia tenebrosa TaxID=6105 RepID=A0A6P8IAF2_ACTTE|nr:alpha-methylacyl-CoA racemase-like [Actinia tenebrosa]
MDKMAALSGVRVLELAGLAPAPFAGMILADFGATVTRVDKVKSFMTLDRLARGKRSIALDLKSPRGVETFRRLCSKTDVMIEPFRPGVMEQLGLGPKTLMKENPRLIYARLTGFGQDGPMASQAGHDINYIAISGMLSMLGRKDSNLMPPLNLLGDFAGGGLMCVMGILIALLERNNSGQGQVIDSAMIDGAAYIGSFVYKSRDIWPAERGGNLLDTGAHFYDTYQTLDGKFVSVGAIEPKFYKVLLEGLGIREDDLSQQLNFKTWAEKKKNFAKVFATKTRDEWCEIFKGTDACFAPVLSLDEAPLHPHNQRRNTFMKNGDEYEPTPAPKLSRTPGNCTPRRQPSVGQHTIEVLLEAGFGQDEVTDLLKKGVIESQTKSSL